MPERSTIALAITGFALLASLLAVTVASTSYTAGYDLRQLLKVSGSISAGEIRFIIAVGPFIPFWMLLSAGLKNSRLSLFGVGMFIAWSAMTLQFIREIDDSVNNASVGQAMEDALKGIEGGLVVMLLAGLLSMASLAIW
jgi:hypothetical protein